MKTHLHMLFLPLGTYLLLFIYIRLLNKIFVSTQLEVACLHYTEIQYNKCIVYTLVFFLYY